MPSPRKGKEPKRSPLSKQMLAEQMQRNQKVENAKRLARLAFPAVDELATVYDAQTAFNAVSGTLQQALAEHTATLKVSSLAHSIEKVPAGPIKDAIVRMLEALAAESIEESVDILTLMGRKLPEFLAQKHLKDPLSEVPLDEFIAG